jgi:hypothetical protein
MGQAFTDAQYKKLMKQMPNWEKDLAEVDNNTIIMELRDLGLPAPRGAMANAILKFIEEQPFQRLSIPSIDPNQGPEEFYERASSIAVARNYITSVVTHIPGRTSDALSSDPITKKPTDKFKLLGASGMPGIGKTEFLKHVAKYVVPKVAKATKKKIRCIYVSFSGGSSENTTLFGNFCAEHESPGMTDAKRRNLLGRAFAHVLLTVCGAKLRVSTSISLPEAVEKLRTALRMAADDVLAIFVDEVIDLGCDALETIKPVMSTMDAAKGKLVFLFSHIDQRVLDDASRLSGRVVVPLSLPALPVNIWTKVPKLKLKRHARKIRCYCSFS